jgi:hypothetical protein
MIFSDYSNDEISKVIDDYIHSERDRAVLKRRYIDGIRLESLAEEFDLSSRHIKNIIYKNENVIFKHLNCYGIKP